MFGTLKDSDAVFFSLDFDENAIPCFRINTRKTKKDLTKAVGLDGKSDIDNAVKFIGKGWSCLFLSHPDYQMVMIAFPRLDRLQ